MARLNKVTITGADDSVSPDVLVQTVAKYPLAEVGILFGNHPGTPRFPSEDWVVSLRDAAQKSSSIITLSAHLCGDWVTSFLTQVGGHVPYWVWDMWSRVQLNTHGQARLVQLRNFRHNLVETCVRHDVQVVFQDDGANDDLFRWAHGSRLFNVACLFDRSGGAGRLPSEWPPPFPGAYCGYAGGLSPDNVVTHLCAVHELCDVWQTSPDHSGYWIDAETHLRTDDGARFDLERAEAFLAKASEFAHRQEPKVFKVFRSSDLSGMSIHDLERELRTVRADLRRTKVALGRSEREKDLAVIALRGHLPDQPRSSVSPDAKRLARLRAFQYGLPGGTRSEWDESRVLAFVDEELGRSRDQRRTTDDGSSETLGGRDGTA